MARDDHDEPERAALERRSREDQDDLRERAALEERLVDARPEGDTVTRAVWRARVAAALFGETERVSVGRYQLQRPLGRGGGGSVYIASDPELHREVALKLIRCTSALHRERALAEGRALAKLSHPNVVPVHDVGETADHVYLVMELLRGPSLRDHAASDGTLRELVGAYRQAATGLAAAHAAGLSHRDFKPDNAVLGEDRRLRVVDFGLASSTEAAAVAGTPRYMAPEQREIGAAIGPAVDQYALGVALREALAQRGRGEPAWLTRVIERATAARPEDRFASMEALADALGADPSMRWKRRALIAAPIALAVIGFGVGRNATTDDVALCGGGDEALAPVWTAARSAALVAHAGSLTTPFAAATAPRLGGRLDALSTAWRTAHRRSCLAHERGELSSELYDRATVCLARTRIGLGQAMELLAGATSDAQLGKAVEALSVIERAERCADPLVLVAESRPPTTLATRALDQQIEIAAFHARAATPQAVSLGEAVVAAARGHGDHRLLARALLALGHAYLSDTSTQARAVAPLEEATMHAIASAQDDVAVEAFARHAYALALTLAGNHRRQALDGLSIMRVIGERAGPRGTFARALLSNNVGSVAALLEDFDRARAELRQSLVDGEAVTGPGAAELVITLSSLATLSPDRDERRRLFAAAVDKVVAAVGPEAPQALSRQLQAISDRDDPASIVVDLELLCRQIVRLHPNLVGLGRRCWFELAWQTAAIGATSPAPEAARALPPEEAPSFEARLIAAYGELASGGSLDRTLADLRQLAAEEVAKIDQLGWFRNAYAADAELALAAVAAAKGDHALARRAASLANEHIERWAAVTGAIGGMMSRRAAWARRLAAGGR
jgi:eukaryotic-like serine/threonine-protein kinase